MKFVSAFWVASPLLLQHALCTSPSYGAIINTDGRDLVDVTEQPDEPLITDLEHKRQHVYFQETRLKLIERKLGHLSIGHLLRTILEVGLLSVLCTTFGSLPLECPEEQYGKLLLHTVLFALGVSIMGMIISIIHAVVHGRALMERAPWTAKAVLSTEALAFALSALRAIGASVPFGALGTVMENPCHFIESLWVVGNELPAVAWISIQLFPTAFLLMFFAFQMINSGSILNKKTALYLDSKESLSE